MLAKFRTMRILTGPDGKPAPDDARLTSLGSFLRRSSLDELPELMLVLSGRMSLVGPRPLLPEYLSRYSPRQARRHEVLPGLTGLAQIRGRNSLSWKEKLELDVQYVERLSFALDLSILVETIWAVVRGRGITAAGHPSMPEFLGTEETSDQDDPRPD
jgi:lipopolysaccharide/colanic/teichoic acid biosynthesis glycosyltransferase